MDEFQDTPDNPELPQEPIQEPIQESKPVRPTYGPFPQEGKGKWIDRRKARMFSEEFLELKFRQHHGQLVLIADDLGIGMGTLTKYKKRYPRLGLIEKYEKKKLVPKSKSVMANLLDDEDPDIRLKAARFILTNSPEGKEAGWGNQRLIEQKVEITKNETKTIIGPEILQQLLEAAKKPAGVLPPIIENTPAEIGLKELGSPHSTTIETTSQDSKSAK